VETFHLRLLGEFNAWVEPGIPIVFPTRKAKALVAYLGSQPGKAHSRAEIASLLWGNFGDSQARDSLRHALALVRKTLLEHGNECLDAGRNTVRIDPAMIETDVELFRDLCKRATPEALGQAAQLYEGEFLGEFYLGEVEFDEWVNSERAQLNELFLRALNGLLTHYVAMRDSENGIPIAIRLLTLDRLREDVHRALMQFYLQQGRRGAALKQYEGCRSILRDELNVEPEIETEALWNSPREVVHPLG
jgi:DNA-binding SARP family transcriptional activator